MPEMCVHKECGAHRHAGPWWMDKHLLHWMRATPRASLWRCSCRQQWFTCQKHADAGFKCGRAAQQPKRRRLYKDFSLGHEDGQDRYVPAKPKLNPCPVQPGEWNTMESDDERDEQPHQVL